MGNGITRRDALGGLAATFGMVVGGPFPMSAPAGAAIPQTAHVAGWVISSDYLAGYERFGLRLVRCDDGSFRLISMETLPVEWRGLVGIGARVTTSRLSERRPHMLVAVADVFDVNPKESAEAISARGDADHQGWLRRIWTERRVVGLNDDGPVLALMPERLEQFSDPIELDYMTLRRFPRLQLMTDGRINDIVRISWGQSWDRALLFDAVGTGENIAPPPRAAKGMSVEEARMRVRILERQIARGLNPTAKVIAKILNDPENTPVGR